MKTKDLKEGKLYFVDYKGRGISSKKFTGVAKYWQGNYYEIFLSGGTWFDIKNVKREATKEDIENFKEATLERFKEKLDKFCKNG